MIRSDANQERSQSRTQTIRRAFLCLQSLLHFIGSYVLYVGGGFLNKEFFSSDIGATWLKHLDKARGEGVTNFNQKVGLGSGGILKECMADTILAHRSTQARNRGICLRGAGFSVGCGICIKARLVCLVVNN